MDRQMIMESGVSDIIKNCTDFIMNQTSLKWLKQQDLDGLDSLIDLKTLIPARN
jgi:hypothetical protein